MKYFKIYKPAFSDEDAEPVAEGNMLIICDGLGATGQNKHEINGQENTSAYWGARLVSCTAKDFFLMNQDGIWNEEPQFFFQKFKKYLGENLSEYINLHNLQKTIKGKSAELLPTTFAMAVFKEDEEFIHIFSIWAGDSRIYLLSADDGLQQISKDDVEGTFDAMKSLGTSNMCNNISGEGEEQFYLNYKQYKIKKQPNLFLFAASDGCFDYLATPMDFEYLLEVAIDCLAETDDISLIETNISSIYSGENLRDDTTMAGVIFNETCSEKLKQQYKERFKKIENSFRKPTEESRQKIRTYENDINAQLPAVNMALRDLSKQVVSYACSLLDEPQTDENSYLKDKIYNLPCMTSYMENIQERSNSIENFKNQQNKIQLKLKFMENDIAVSFQNEYIPIYIKAEKINDSNDITKLEKLVIKYREIVEENAHSAEKLNYIADKAEIMLRNIQSDINDKNYDNFQMHLSNLKNDVCKIEKDGKDILGEGQNTEHQLYQSIIDEFSKSGELDRVYNNVKNNGFIGFSETNKLYADYMQIKNTESQYTQKIAKLTDNSESIRHIRSLGNEFVIEFISIPDIETWISYDMYNKIKQYKQMCEKKDALEKTIDVEHNNIDSLWRDKYKETYELYDTVCGGKV